MAEKRENGISPVKVRELFDYNPDNGKLYWKVSRQKIQKGSEAGGEESDGYVRTRIDGDLYYNQVLVYMHITGKDVPRHMEIDHINRKRNDNRQDNLRLSTKSENQKNKNSF